MSFMIFRFVCRPLNSVQHRVRNLYVAAPSRAGAPVLALREEEPSLSPEVEDTLAGFTNTLSRWTNIVQNRWEEMPNSERPAAVAIVVASVIAQLAIGATVDSIDKIPLFKQFFEVVGLAVALYTAYNYTVEPTRRDNLKKRVSSFVNAVTGK
ncbi:MAG: hypothetical protein WDW38_000411 [Sanguina aurantia]